MKQSIREDLTEVRPKPRPRTYIGAKVSPDTKKALLKLAKRHGWTLTEVIKRAFLAYLEGEA